MERPMGRGVASGRPMGEALYDWNYNEGRMTVDGRHPPQGSAISTEAYVFDVDLGPKW
jgi:hypothetical protein